MYFMHLRLYMFILLFGLNLFGTPFATAQANPGGDLISRAEEIFDLSIMGSALATKEQCIQYLLKKNPTPLITVSPEELVDCYYREGEIEGIRPDVALAQAFHETGFFRYGGDVNALQNNYAGIGTTGAVVNNKRVQGHSFANASEGVRSQIQHLVGYATTRPPRQEIIDPRYNLLKSTPFFGEAKTWTDLNGKWAVPGETYGQMILKIHADILSED